MMTRRILSLLMTLSLVIALACVPAMADASQVEFSMTVSQDTTLDIRFLADEAASLLKLSASIASQGTAITAQAALSGNGVCFTFDPFIPDWYGIDLVNVESNFASSVLAPGSGSAFAIDQESYDAMAAAVNQCLAEVSSAVESTGTDAETAANPFEDYTAVVQESLASDMTSQNFYKTVTVANEEVDAAVSIVKFGTEALVSAFNAIADKAAEDEVLADLFARAAQNAAEGEETLTLEQFVSSLRELAESAESENITLTVSTFTNRQSGETVYGDVRMGNDAEAIGMEFFNVYAVKKVQLYTFRNDSYEIPAGVEFLLDTLDDQVLECRLHVIEDGKNICIVNLKAENAAQDMITYEISAETLEDALTCSGRLTLAEDGIVSITVDEINGEPSDAVFSFGPAEPEETPEFIEILAMDETQFGEFVQLISQVASLFA